MSVWPKFCGMTFAGYPGVIFAFGSLIDWEISVALMPLSAVSRFGPVVPVVPACARV